MSHSFASLMIAALALSAVPYTVTSAQRDDRAEALCHRCDSNIEILVNGVPQRRYAHDGRWYVEALKGREYAIRMRNPYPVRVAVALSVDGLNTIDARRTAAADARKWVLGPYETATISGWQVNSKEARRFEFTTEADSYGQALGKTANLGVISAVFFKERVAAVARESSNERDRSGQRGAPAAPPAPSAAPAAESAARASGQQKLADEYAATGMGDRTDHAVTQVWLDLEEKPAQTMNIRYEFRAQLVKLGILPAAPVANTMQRRERARGFEPGFSPEVR